jgi:hypothetical protein
VVEGDYIDFELIAGDFLGFDPLHLSNAMGGVDDMIANREFQTALAHSFQSFRPRPVPLTAPKNIAVPKDKSAPPQTCAAPDTLETD